MNAHSIRFLFNPIIILALAMGLLILAGPAASAPAAVFIINVTTTADEFNLIGSGTGCSLREAIKTANDAANFGGCVRVSTTGSGPDTIVVPSDTYTLSISGASEDLDATGDLDIRNNMFITASGLTPPVVTGGLTWDDRIFHVHIGFAEIDGFNIRGGHSNGYGGAVLIESTGVLTMNNDQVANSTSGTTGGGFVNAGALTLNSVTVSGNTANGFGGGIFNASTASLFIMNGGSVTGNSPYGIENEGTATLNNVSISNNTYYGLSNLGSSTLNNVTITGNRNGIYNYDVTSVVVMNGGTISGNKNSYVGGAGINSVGPLTLNYVNISDNSTPVGTGNNGGGIWLANATSTLNGVTLDSNQAGDGGGGIFITGGAIVTMTNVIISHNTAANGGGVFLGPDTGLTAQANVNMAGVSITGNFADYGAGIYEQLASGSIELRGITLSKNTATTNGGAIDLETGPLTIFNSTLSGNSATYYGGAIYQSVDVATMTNVTISGNSAAHGGGIWGASIVNNTIVASSSSSNNCGQAIGGTGNLSDDASCGFGSGREGVNPLLIPLGNYGGPTQTMVPLLGSPVIDAAIDAACLATDQRGKPRPAGPHCDVGAVERQALDYPFIFLPLIYR
jgi:CSLREA domain-containing protein